MTRAIHKLTALEVETRSKPGRHSDGGGLYLLVDGKGRRSWVFMYTSQGRQREAGLGAAGKNFVTLKAAREKAAEARALIKASRDPLEEWRKPEPQAEEIPTFGAAADEYLTVHEGSFRNDKHRAQ